MPADLNEEQLFSLEGCGTYKQYHHMRSQFEGGICAFCEVDSELNKVLFENREWFVFENAFKGDRACKTMLVIVSKQHIRTLAEITPYEWAQFGEMMEWITKHYELPGGMLFIRFGDLRLNAGTVPHIHWNLWVPDEEKEVRIPLFKDPKKREENQLRAAAFAQCYERGEQPKENEK